MSIPNGLVITGGGDGEVKVSQANLSTSVDEGLVVQHIENSEVETIISSDSEVIFEA